MSLEAADRDDNSALHYTISNITDESGKTEGRKYSI